MDRRSKLIVMVLGVLLLACDSDDRGPKTSPSLSPSASSPGPLACGSPDGSGPLVAYTDERDLWLYDVDADERNRLTDDGESRYEHEPEFLSADCIVYANSEPTTIEIMDLSGERSTRTIVEEAGLITSVDISPDGASILYLHINFDVDGTYRLKRVDVDGGEPVVLHTFARNPGRGAGSEDEVSVAWSPDGSSILVANTYEDSSKPIYLFDRTGRSIIARWTGTHPRWSPDGGTIYYRGYAGMNGQNWYAKDVATMETAKLGIRPGTNRLVVAPDGERVAYDTSYFGDYPLGTEVSGEAPNVYVYNLATGKEALLEKGALEPLWVSASQVLVTDAKEPARSLNSWESLGTVRKISVSGTSAPVEMTSTLFDSTVYLGA